MTIQCVKSGKPRWSQRPSVGPTPRKTGSKRDECPFRLYANCKNGIWHLSVRDPSHNHPADDIINYSQARKLKPEQVRKIKQLLSQGLPPRKILESLQTESAQPIIMRDIYNQIRLIRREKQNNGSNMDDDLDLTDPQLEPAAQEAPHGGCTGKDCKHRLYDLIRLHKPISLDEIDKYWYLIPIPDTESLPVMPEIVPQRSEPHAGRPIPNTHSSPTVPPSVSHAPAQNTPILISGTESPEIVTPSMPQRPEQNVARPLFGTQLGSGIPPNVPPRPGQNAGTSTPAIQSPSVVAAIAPQGKKRDATGPAGNDDASKKKRQAPTKCSGCGGYNHTYTRCPTRKT